jgi:ribosomal protein S18 acetylase RimI-like enzyme
MQIRDIWAIEEGFSLAWPALVQQQVGGWLLKAGEGVSRRSNSANPTAKSQPLREVLPAIELFYQEQRLPALIRTLSIQASSVESELAHLGFHQEGDTRTLCAPELDGRDEARTVITTTPSSIWIDGINDAQQRVPADRMAFERHIKRISLPCAFGSTLDGGGKTVAWAYGALNGARLYIESVVTRCDHRRNGHAKRTVRALIDWAKRSGASSAVLQVQANNKPACNLYEGLGFTEELYRYRYWRA